MDLYFSIVSPRTILTTQKLSFRWVRKFAWFCYIFDFKLSIGHNSYNLFLIVQKNSQKSGQFVCAARNSNIESYLTLIAVNLAQFLELKANDLWLCHTAVHCTLSFCNVITTLSQKITEMMKGVFIIVISILIHGLSIFF